MIQLFNTLTGKKEEFVPLKEKEVKIYACGPTVYDYSHIGHARVFIIWDVISRYLRHRGYDVTMVRNITDIDDKIIKRAKERGKRPEQVAREFIYQFWYDMHALNVQPPDFEPRATEFIAPMIRLVENLIKSGHAYVAGGDVYFDVSSFKEYGKLGKKDAEQLMSGMRDMVRSQDELADLKKSPVDFALWKGAAEGEIGWPSPWGNGRPGWHLECSTMIENVLGDTIDIHGGGEDLVFPHHENEIAQSEALHAKPLARYWLHNSFVQINQEKMSKSLGNFATIQDLLKQYSADTLRLFLLQTHYRHPIEFSPEALNACKTALSRLVRAASLDDSGNGSGDASEKPDEVIAEFRKEFTEAMDNDFNSAIAISALFSLADRIFQSDDPPRRRSYVDDLKKYAAVLGLTLTDTRKEIDTETAAGIMDLTMQLRKEARAKKDYATSDLIRKRLADMGVSIMDTADGGSVWEKS